MIETRIAPNENRSHRQREDRLEQILQAAKEVFSERGYHSASINEIIERAGIARGTFYLYFANKRRVFDAILQEAIEALTSRIVPVSLAADAAAPRQQLHENLGRVFSYLLADKPLSELLLNQGLTPDPESAERIEAFYGQVIVLIRASLDHGVALGLVRPCRTDLIAAALFGAVRGLAEKLLSAAEPTAVDVIIDELMRFALHGVVVPERWAHNGASLHG